MDNYCEQLVEKKKTGSDIAKMTAIMLAITLGAVACVIAAFLFGLGILLAAAIGLLVLGIWLMSGMNVEYEYIITNNEMDIDKIIGRRKRKRMITVDLARTDDMGGYPSEKSLEADTTVHATSGLEKDAHYLLVQHKDYGKVKVIFNPNEKLREAIAQEVPKALSVKLKHDVK